MRFLRIFLSLFGCVKVNLKGKEISRFLRLCSTHHIMLWDITSKEMDEISFFMSARDVFRLPAVLRKTNCRFCIEQKEGLPFLLKKYRWKIAFRGSIVCAFFLFWYLTTFIWSIHLSGNSYLTEEYLQYFLKEQHAYIGCRSKDIDTVALEEKLLEQFSEVIWASIYIKGTSLHITVKEQIRLPEQKEDVAEQSRDLISPVDGKVADIFVRNGTEAVKKGDEVKQGDVLIHGWVPVYDDMATQVLRYETAIADGDVLIESRYPYREEVKATYQKKIWDDKTMQYLTFATAQESTDLIPYLIPQQKRTMFCETKPVSIFGSIPLPLILHRHKILFYNLQSATYTKGEATEILEQKYQQFAKKMDKKGIQIMDKNVIILRRGNVYSMEGEILLRYPATELQQGKIPDLE